MKGTPQAPQCGFSKRVVDMLKGYNVDISGIDVLSNPELREKMKTYSNWPTFPQLYINGEFVGGCDITTQMHKDGELKPLLEASGSPAAAK